MAFIQAFSFARIMLILSSSVNNLVRLDPETGVVEEFPIPFSLGLGNATIPGKTIFSSV